jgi:hypothetical protein
VTVAEKKNKAAAVEDLLREWSDDDHELVLSSDRGEAWWKAHGGEVDAAAKLIQGDAEFHRQHDEFCRWHVECAIAELESFSGQWRRRLTPVTKETKTAAVKLLKVLARVDAVLGDSALDPDLRTEPDRTWLRDWRLRVNEAATVEAGSREGGTQKDASVRRAAIYQAHYLIAYLDLEAPDPGRWQRFVDLAKLLGASLKRSDKEKPIWKLQDGNDIDIARMCKKVCPPIQRKEWGFR